MEESDDEEKKGPGFRTVAGTTVPALPNYAGIEDALKLTKEVDASNFYGAVNTKVVKNAKWRIDRQKKSRDHTNLQIQLNGVDAPSTVACVLVPDRLSDEYQGAAEQRKKYMNTELARAIKTAFRRSFNSLESAGDGQWVVTVYKVFGGYSS